MELARLLREEAQRADERRVLVVAGNPNQTRERASAALEAADVPREATTLLAEESWLDCERHEQSRAAELLGRTRSAVILDAHTELRPNALGIAVGAVDGGGLLVLVTPPLDRWSERRDAFDEGLAVPPFDREAVTGHFRRRLVETVRAHRGIAIVGVGADGEARIERDGLTDPGPRRPPPTPRPPADTTFPGEAYEACRTDDQVTAVQAFESLRDPDSAVVVEADRGRGKSSAAGLAAAALAAEGEDILVTAPDYRNCAAVFARARELFERLGIPVDADRDEQPKVLRTRDDGRVRYAKPAAAVELPDEPDVVVVDEAAALPVRRLESFLAEPAVAFTTTVHGYEGAGRGFSVRFRDRLDESDHTVREATMTVPIRYADTDPVETWAFRALLLDARPPIEQLVDEATPETVTYRRLNSEELLADEHLLREVFGLLVLAHYRTEPADLARLLDGPNVTVRALTHDGHVVAVALLAREGGLDSGTRAAMYEGERVRGNMVPDVLSTQLRDESAGVTVGQRVLRIATHAAVRSRGLGSRLLGEIRAEFRGEVDWLGVGYGATPELIQFWRHNGYSIVHLSTSRNDTSGEYSAVMLDPCSAVGAALASRHTGWFCDRIGATLSDALADCDPDVVRAALRAADAVPDPGLSEWEWRIVAGVPGGAAILDTDPDPFRRLAVRQLVAPADPDALTDRQARLLVRKVLQARPWPDVADELGYVSQRECKRDLGTIAETLTRLYGDPWAIAELERHR